MWRFLSPNLTFHLFRRCLLFYEPFSIPRSLTQSHQLSCFTYNYVSHNSKPFSQFHRISPNLTHCQACQISLLLHFDVSRNSKCFSQVRPKLTQSHQISLFIHVDVSCNFLTYTQCLPISPNFTNRASSRLL